LEAGCTRLTGHAKSEMRKDGLTALDVTNVLRGGAVHEPESEHGSWRYQVRTGRIVVVCEFEDEEESEEPGVVVVVTVWRVRS